MEMYFEKRPWGRFERFCKNKICTVKLIYIKKNEELSLQSHKKRDEFWKIISGKAMVGIGNRKVAAKKGKEFFIPKNIAHRIKAQGGSVEMLEISFGKFDEKDEVRIEDKYQRNG